MAPLHSMGAHEGEAIGFRECVHRRVVCDGGGDWAAAACVAAFDIPCACGIMWQSQGGHKGAGSCT
jgi:hypothetical protein